MYTIVVGAGRTGNKVIELATKDGNEVVVIEHDQGLAEEVGATYDCMVINANTVSKESMLEAGIQKADALISATENDSVNLMTSMLGKQYGVETLVSSINDPEHMELFGDLGVSTVESPHELSGQYLYRAVQRPAIRDFMEIGGGGEIFELMVEEGTPIAGVSLVDADSEGSLSQEIIIVAIVRDGDSHIPRGELDIQAGDTVTIFAKNGASDNITDAFTGP